MSGCMANISRAETAYRWRMTGYDYPMNAHFQAMQTSLVMTDILRAYTWTLNDMIHISYHGIVIQAPSVLNKVGILFSKYIGIKVHKCLTLSVKHDSF